MTTMFNATAQVRTKLDVDDAMSALDGYHPAIGPAAGKTFDVTISLPAETLRQAITSALAVLEQQLGPVLALEVLTSDAFDARLGLEPVPELVSVTEVAAELGVSRQAVLQRLEAGTLPGQKVGSTWVVPAAALAPERTR